MHKAAKIIVITYLYSNTYDAKRLQTAIYNLSKIITQYGLKISTDRSKVLVFQGRDPTRSKIVIDNKIIEQMNTCNYLGNLVSYEIENDIYNKMTTF
jgi:hypothetical protein